MKRLFNISTTALVLALVVLLAACDPPTPPQPEDPTPVVPDPIEEVYTLEGDWEGTFSFSDQDLLGNIEEMVLGALMSLEYIETSSAIHGTMVLDTDDEACSVGGTQSGHIATLTIFCRDLQAFTLTGEVDAGQYVGDYTTIGTVLRNGVFGFSYVGGR